MKKDSIKLYLIPFVFAVFAIAHDFNYVGGSFTVSCLKDFLFIFLFGAIAYQVYFEKVDGRGLSEVALVALLITSVADYYVGRFLPDTWISTQRTFINGYPFLELMAIATFVGLITLGRKRKSIKSMDVAIYSAILASIIFSSRFWFYHVDYLEENPSYSWTLGKETKSVELFDDGRFVGHEWLKRNADYGGVIDHMTSTIDSEKKTHIWWGSLVGDAEPVLMKIELNENNAVLSYQGMAIEWDGDMKWTPVGFLSVLFLFIAAFLSGGVLARSFIKSKD